MREVPKLLIAYDGSACADAALDDLGRAGLPAAVGALVVTVADVFLPPPDEEVADEEVVVPGLARRMRPAHAQAEKAVKEALAVAGRAAKRVKEDFPGWEVRAEACGDVPAWAVVKMADHIEADLVVIGSHGHASAGGRLILGSTSQRVLYEARCPVRVARCAAGRREGPVRVVVGYNGSPDSEAAVVAVASRAWPAGSEARVVTSREGAEGVTPDAQTEKLRAAGLAASHVFREGGAAHVLIEEAEGWGADSIFVGTRDLHGLKHFLRGSVSSAVAARASCSVEVVRSRKGAAGG